MFGYRGSPLDVVAASIGRVEIKLPEDFVFLQGGLSLRWADDPSLDQVYRLQEQKLPAAMVRATKHRKTLMQ
ncbi:MAG: hypothetical protein CL798_08195 [Chromatiales bacterium]|nr:hypothetical protein [Chromatiales bacterium]